MEIREQPTPRSFQVIMVRHGKQQEYTDAHSSLSPEGEVQANNFATNLFEQLRGSNTVVKVKTSPEARTHRTADIIEETLRSAVEQDADSGISVLQTRTEDDLKTTGALRPMMEAGVPQEEALEEWATNADAYPSAKKPAEVLQQLRNVIGSTRRLAERIGTEGPNVTLVWVTHETAHTALAQHLTGKTPAELGGRIEHLEPLALSLSADPNDPIKVTFRDQQYELPSDDDSNTDTT